MSKRPEDKILIGKDPKVVPMSVQRVLAASDPGEMFWVGPNEAVKIDHAEQKAYELAQKIMIRLAIEAPLKHKSGHPGGPLSAFTFAYEVNRRRDPNIDHTMRFSAGHLSLLAFLLEYLFGRNGSDPKLSSPQAIMDSFRTPSGLSGHAEAGIGDIPFGAGPLGKGVSNALGIAFGDKFMKKNGKVDVLMADGDSQEGQVMEAFRLAAHLKLDRLMVHGDWNDIQLSGLPSKTMATDMASIASATGWNVIEVQNGNDIAQVRAANDLADSLIGKGKPIFICYYTTMGYGVKLMEEGSNTGNKNFHGAPLSDAEAKLALDELSLPSLEELTTSYETFQKPLKARFEKAKKARASSRLSFTLPKGYKRTVTTEKGAARKDFGAVHVKNLMKIDPRIVVLHADLAGSGGFDIVGKEFPDRVINVGVAEANMYMMAAGMRQAGLLPITYTFAAFGTNEARANARLIDINSGHVPLGVIHDCTHAGLSVGEDGETHQERNYANIPFDHTRVWVPGDSNQAAAMAEKALEIIADGKESVYIFSSRSGHPQLLNADKKPIYDERYSYDGKMTLVAGFGDERDEATIISYGAALHEAVKAVDLLNSTKRHVRLLNCSSIRPLDASAILQAVFETQHLIVVEDHNIEGGLATQIADLVADLALPCTLRRLGARHYFPSGTTDDLFTLAGIDSDNIANVVEDQFSYRLAGGEEAFLAAVHALAPRLHESRFIMSAEDYVTRLHDDDRYFDRMRTLWKSRAIASKDLPSNDDIKKILKNYSKNDTMNTITGTERAPQHDIGIV